MTKLNDELGYLVKSCKNVRSRLTSCINQAEKLGEEILQLTAHMGHLETTLEKITNISAEEEKQKEGIKE